MRGKARPPPVQSPSVAAAAGVASAAAVSPRTAAEYQPIRVLMSVLLMPAAATWISTSPGPGSGRGTSSR